MTRNTRNTRTPTGHFHYYSELALRSQGHNTRTLAGHLHNSMGLTPLNQGNNTRNTPLEIRVNVLTCNDMEIVL
ncbi:MAG: hypothetical protein U9Q76_02130 [candidate division WOR-3 bacterium]|nr:hypothetical protein [candidate division WOR-3 bacterium]